MENSGKVSDERRAGSQRERLTIGFLTHGIADDYGIPLWKGVMDAAREEDVNLIAFPGWDLGTRRGFEIQANVLYYLAGAENVDGLVISSAPMTNYEGVEGFGRLCERYRPLPMATCDVAPFAGIPYVVVEHYQGMRQAIAHLIETHARRHIAFIPGPQGNVTADVRYRAYVDTLTEYGLPFDSSLVATHGNYDDASGIRAARLLLDERRVHFDALIAANDAMAIGTLQVFHERGIDVPGDVAVVGFNDATTAGFVTPPLTTVRYPISEQMYRATKLVLAQLRGEKVPEQVVLPAELVVRQSCGCQHPEVVQAGIEPLQKSYPTLEAAIAAQRERIIADMTQAARASGSSSEGMERLLDAFVTEVKEGSSGVFLSVLERAMRNSAATGGAIASWQGALSALRHHTLAYLGPDDALPRAENLWQQARVMIGEAAQRAQAYQAWLAEQQATLLREVGQLLMTTFDLSQLLDAIPRELPRLGIKQCYLSLYENPAAPLEWARLLLAYNEEGPVKLEDGGQRFPAPQLVPKGLLPSHRRCSLVVEPLYFRDEQLGFVLLEAESAEEGAIYDALRGQISSALKGAMLVQQVEQHNRVLQRRAVQLEASAQIGRAITSIFDVDRLLRQTVDLIRDRFGFHHVGIFLLDETGEWAVLQEATGEAGLQMKAQGHRLAVDGTSMVGWTALHREPRIAWDVGKDAVRLAHPLLSRTRSEMTLPLMVGGRVLGVLNVQSEEEAAFDQDDVRTLQSMADQVAIAIENARRLSDDAALLEATSPIYRLSRRLTTAISTTDVADAIIASVAETVADGCVVIEFEFSPDGKPEALRYLGVWRRDREPQFQAGQRLAISESLFPLDLVSTFWIVPDIEQGEQLPLSARRVFRETGVRALVNIPLHARERLIGQVVVLRSTPEDFPPPAVRLYEALSGQAAVALERVQLLEEARRRAESEQLARQALDRIRRAANLEQALQTAAQELAQAMEVPHVTIELAV